MTVTREAGMKTAGLIMAAVVGTGDTMADLIETP